MGKETTTSSKPGRDCRRQRTQTQFATVVGFFELPQWFYPSQWTAESTIDYMHTKILQGVSNCHHCFNVGTLPSNAQIAQHTHRKVFIDALCTQARCIDSPLPACRPICSECQQELEDGPAAKLLTHYSSADNDTPAKHQHEPVLASNWLRLDSESCHGSTISENGQLWSQSKWKQGPSFSFRCSPECFVRCPPHQTPAVKERQRPCQRYRGSKHLHEKPKDPKPRGYRP